jgi:predicted DNA-binding antitoxin AbrB/MazE fold protein
MSIVIDATYEDGVLKPAQPLPLAEHEKVRVTVEQQLQVAAQRAQSTAQTVPSVPSLGEQIVALAEALPEEVVSQWPRDGASQHDHYIYGTPKRSDLSE